jgi:hypothetical protein
MKKTKEDIIFELQNKLLKIETLYKEKCVNINKKTSDSKEWYSEIISNELLKCLSLFEKIPKTEKTTSYCVNSHEKIIIDTNNPREEEIFAKRLMGINLGELGDILDYQIPHKDSNDKIEVENIDLISCNKETKTIFLIELKYEGNKETLLKSCLESYTYHQTVDRIKLVNDCCNNSKNGYPENISDFKITPAVLVVPRSNAYHELTELQYGLRPKLQALTLALDIELFTLDFMVCRI